MSPNQASDKEKAEGSRENVNAGTGADNPMERGSGQESHPARPLSEEEERDKQVPPRGHSK